MENKKSFIISLILLVALVGGASLLYNRLSKNVNIEKLESPVTEETENGKVQGNLLYPAPDFTVTDNNGKAVKLSDFRGRPIVLNFWASWCGPCKREMPDFDKVYREYGDDIVFMMVNLADGRRETVETAKKFLSDTGYTFPVYYDTESSAAYAYYVNSVPATYFINADGFIVVNALGAINHDVIIRGINMITEKES